VRIAFINRKTIADLCLGYKFHKNVMPTCAAVLGELYCRSLRYPP
jgi:hypothetical protein